MFRGRAVRLGLGAAVATLVVGGLAPLASSTAATDGNPDLPAVCGLDVTLVLDDSGSISSTEAGQVRQAADTFASALVGTPSRVKVGVFSSRATGVSAAGSATSSLGSIVFRDPADYTDPTSGAGSGGTNWDDGLEVARRSAGGPGDLVVFITDGDPTYRNSTTPDGHLDDGSHSISGDGNTIGVAANLNQAVSEADSIKAGGAHMFGIGVGLTDAASEQRLNDVTGDEELTLDGSGNPNIPFGTADYTIAPDFTKLQSIIRAFVRDLCAPSVNVTKFLQRADGTTVQAGAGDPWTFGVDVSPTPTSWQTPVGASGSSASQATDASGGVSFKWKMSSNTATVDLTETAKPGWVYNGARCTRNLLDGSDPTVIFDSVGTNAPNQSKDSSQLHDLTVGLNEAVNCDVYNRQIRPGSVTVTKQTAPAGQPESFDFTLTRGASTVGTASLTDGQSSTFGSLVPGTYALAEAANAAYVPTSSSCDDLATTPVEATSPSSIVVGEAGSWSCRFLNTAKPGSITVVKKAIGADGTFSFTSNVPDLGNFDLTTASGTASTQTIAVPVGTYAITEGSAAPWQLTSASCTGQQSPGTVHVGAAQDVVCTFTNTAPDPTIDVTKTAGVTTVAEPGGSVTYTVTVANTSVEPVTISSLTDSIEGGPDLDITTVAGPITATTCGNLLQQTLDATGPGSSATCTFTADVDGNGGDQITDQVTASAYDSSEKEATDTDGASVDVTSVAPTLAVTKTPSVTTIAEPGGSISYEVEITNTGVEPVQLDAIRDSIEGGAAFDATTVSPPVTSTSCGARIGTTLAPGGSTSCTFTTANVVDLADLGDGDLDDTVTVEGHDDDAKVTATAAAEVAVTDARPTLEVTKTPTPTSVAETAPGQTRPVEYLVTIQNTSPETVQIGSITDAVDGGAPAAAGGTCAALVGTSLAAGAGTSCTFTLGVSGNEGDQVADVVTVAISDDDGNEVTDSDAATVDITGLPSSIVVTKTAAPSSVPEPGAQVSFGIEIENTSAADAVTLTSILDAVDGAPGFAAGGSCAALLGTSLAPGASTSCSFQLAVDGNAGDQVDDVVTVSGTDDDGDPVADDAPEQVDITDVPSSLAVTKTADVASVTEPGGPVTYTVDIRNTSEVDPVTISTITDAVDGAPAAAAGGTCPALIGTVIAPGGSTSCSFTLQVSGNAGDAVGDVVVVSGTDDDGGEVADSDAEVVDVTDDAAVLTVTKDPSPATVPEPGADVTYTLQLTNSSEADVIEIDSIVDAVEGGAPFAVAGTCDDLVGTDLAPGASATCAFTLAVAGNGGDSVHDTVTVTGHDDDPIVSSVGKDDGALASAVGNPVTASASAVVDVDDVLPTGTASKTADPATVPEPGGPVAFHASVTNTSASEAATVTAITDTIDGTAVDVTTVGGPVTATDCATGTVLAPGATYSCTFTLLISGADAGDSLVDQIGITLTDDEGNSVTPTDTETVAVTDVLPTISVVKDNGDASLPAPGGDVTFDVTVTNTSAAEAVTLTTLTDTIEGGAPFDLTTTTPPIASTTCATGGTIAVGGSYECSFTLAVTSDEAITQADVVDARAVDDEGNPATAGDGAVTSITASADLAIDKRLVDGPLTGGNPGTFELEVTNDGPSTAAGVSVVDTAPDGLTPIAAEGDGWACAIDGQAVTCTRPSLAAGDRSVITVTVDVSEAVIDQEVVNVADVGAETDDPDLTNNHDEVATVPEAVQDQTVDSTTTTTTVAPGAPTGTLPSGTLARTGSDPGPLTTLAVCPLGLGAIVLLGRRAQLAGRR